MDLEVETVKNLLVCRFYHATSEWIEGCVGYYKSTLESLDNSSASLESFVLGQWILGDLREMGQGCLPPGLSSVLKTVLLKTYAVQVESMLDIGQSSYTQLQRIRNVSTENVDLTEKATPSWEPKLNRMIQFSLTDGFQDVKAIEYSPIKSFHPGLLPGNKVLIIGPVECRRGVILLQEHNLQFLGGEIDSLLISNAVENILARNLNLEETLEPYKNVIDDTCSTLRNPARDTNSTVVTSCSTIVSTCKTEMQQFSSNSRVCATQLPLDEDMFEAEMDAETLILETQYEQERNDHSIDFDEDMERHFAALGPGSDVHHAGPNDSPQMMASVFSNVSNANPYEKQISQSNKRQSSDLKGSHTRKVLLNTPAAGSAFKVNEQCFTNLLAEDDDILMNISVEELESNVSNNARTAHPGVIMGHNQSKAPGKSLKEPQKWVTPYSNVTKKTQSKITSFLRSDLASSANNNKGVVGNVSHHSQTKTFAVGTASKRPAPDSPVKLLSPSFCHGFNDQPSSHKNKDIAMQSHFLLHGDSKVAVPCNSNTYTSNIKEIQHSTNRENNSLVPNCVPSLRGQLKDHQSTMKKVEPVLTSPHPFVYLSQVVDTEVEHQVTYTVKAFVVTLLSRLGLKPEGWQLTAKLGDGSATLDVNFSSEVLETILGVSAAEAQSMKQEISQNLLVKERVRAILLKAKQQLINLNSLLDIKFSTCHTELPMVTKVTDVSSEHLKALKVRLSSISTIP